MHVHAAANKRAKVPHLADVIFQIVELNAAIVVKLNEPVVAAPRHQVGIDPVELLGEPPMRYCAGWRMRVAANMLRDGKQNTANIAYSVGFNSEAAFNRAFKRELGEPPATWRRKVEAEEQARARSMERPDLPPQQVRHCTAADGTQLAFSVTGEGPPLVKTANWLNHLEYD